MSLTSFGEVNAQGPTNRDSAEFIWAESYRYFDQPVDPDIYLIRPGEELLITFVRAKVSPIRLTVDPEGNVVDQTLGVFDLSKRTLSEARDVLLKAVTGLYSVEQVAITISEPRRVAISVSGAVRNPGLYKGFTSQRVSEIVEQAGGVTWHGSTRNIIFSGGPGDLAVDLDKAIYLGDNSSNPCLYAGHSIHVPAKSSELLQVVGEVNRPREIELVAGDNLNLVIALAGGARSTANLEAIQVIGSHHGSKNPADRLQAGDVVIVPPVSLKAAAERLTVFGAVKHPGSYDFQSGITVGDLIEQAGGFSPNAGNSLLTLFRKARADEWGRISQLRYPITTAMGNTEKMLSVVLEPADSVYVPFSVGFVEVRGEVLNPGRLPFTDGKDALFYISAAGGFLPTADQTRIAVYNRIAKVTANFSPGVLVHDGYQLIVNVREELR